MPSAIRRWYHGGSFRQRVALRLAAQMKPGEVVTVACDSGMKYLSTDLYE